MGYGTKRLTVARFTVRNSDGLLLGTATTPVHERSVGGTELRNAREGPELLPAFGKEALYDLR